MALPLRLCAALLLSSTLTVLADDKPSVHVSNLKATYHGAVSGSIEHFQGIKFAEDTSGERRFAAPEPYVPEADSVIDASQAGSVCPQTEAAMPLLFDATPEMTEDCLNLRVARPAGVSPDSKLPVVVWLHGGGVVIGSAYDSHFNPDKLLELSQADQQPIIYAAINYRMTMFGFSRLPSLKDQKSLNAGIRDQRMGLQWIKDNIEAFGGDPERITVYGLSAGGTFTSMHTFAYGGEQGVPFQQAWMMSGPPGTAVNMTSDATTAHTMNVAERVNCAEGDDLEVLKCLRTVPMKDLLDVALTYSRENHPPAGLFTFIPSVDDDLFPDRPGKLIQEGRFVKGIKMIYGWTQDDGALNVGDAQAIQTEEDMIAPIKAFGRDISAEQFEGLFALYPETAFEHDLLNYESRKAPTDPSVSVHFFRVSRILRDLLFTCSSIDFGHQMVKQTRETQPKFDNVRLYDLNQSVFTPMMAGASMPYVGAIHGSDTPYLFNGFPEGEFSEDDQTLATSLSRSLINFAYTGSPSTSSHEWPPAYPHIHSEDSSAIPSEFSIEVIGGPYGTGPVLLKRDADSTQEYKMGSQGILDSVLEFAGMGSKVETERKRLIGAEDLHKRCAFLSSLDETLGR